MLGKTSWYKKKRKQEETRSPKPRGEAKPSKNDIDTMSVLFVSYTPNGELVRQLREVMQSIENTLGFRVRIVEKCGTPLKLLFSPTNLWEGVACGREWHVGGRIVYPALKGER